MDRKWVIPFTVVSALALAGCYTQFGYVREEPSSDYSYDDQNNASPADTTQGEYTDEQYQQDRDRFYYPNTVGYPSAYSDPWYRPGISWTFSDPFFWGYSYDPWYYNPYYVPGWYYPYSGFYGYYGNYSYG
ncbi:MAG: hypothetical protein WB699_16835, partial [Bacteroidota bacterium]